MQDWMSATGNLPSTNSAAEEDGVTYDPIEFDPEQTFVDDDVDTDTLALRDAIRDIFAYDGRVELLL
jgi:hypothetical protein